MKAIKLIFWALVAICLITVGLANRGMVTLRALPQALADFAGVSPDIDLPLFVVIFAAVAVGLLIGLIWEWLREFKIRRQVRRQDREVVHLERENDRLREEKHEGEDDVMALLDTPGVRRTAR